MCARARVRAAGLTMSAPSARGVWKKGDMNVLSTTSSAPCARATAAIAAMSVILSVGFVGVSTQMSFVERGPPAGSTRIALATSSGEDMSTKVTSMPYVGLATCEGGGRRAAGAPPCTAPPPLGLHAQVESSAGFLRRRHLCTGCDFRLLGDATPSQLPPCRWQKPSHAWHSLTLQRPSQTLPVLGCLFGCTQTLSRSSSQRKLQGVPLAWPGRMLSTMISGLRWHQWLDRGLGPCE